VVQNAAGEYVDCDLPVALSGTYLLCYDLQGDAQVLNIGTSASTITVQDLLPANTNSNGLFWPNPATGAILFLSTPTGGTETTLYSCNVHQPGAQPTSLGAVALPTGQLEPMSLVDAQ
jgi:hypothetical protein